jgi:glycosyltransferase involved in cell wall biosynthesis
VSPATPQGGGSLRIAVATPRFTPYTGGIETHVLEVSRRLVARGHAVTVLTADPAGTWAATDDVDGIAVRRFPTHPSRGDAMIAPALARAVAEGPWDVVHCQGIHTFVPPMAMAAARKARTPYVVTFHTGGHSQHWRDRIRSTQWRVQRPLLRDAAALVAVSRSERDIFARAVGGNVHIPVVPNGTQPLSVAADAEQNRGSAGPLIVSLGRLERYKGHHRVIGAMPFLLADHPDARLLLAGGGPFEGALRSQVADLALGDRVQFRSFGPHERGELGAAVAAAGVMALLSEYEAHPVAVLEALSVGTPVLGVDSSGLHDLVEDGLITPVPVDASSAHIAQALGRLLDGGRAAAPPVLPTWDDCADAVEQVLRRAVGASSTSTSTGHTR